MLNLTMLVPALFMLQVFDRVFSSRSIETLVMLTLISAVALVLMYFMDTARTSALAAAGKALDRRLGPKTIDLLIHDASRFGGAKNVNIARDAGLLRTFLTGSGIFALFDAPWVPIYLFLMFLFHPLMGLAATGAAVVLFALVVLNERLTAGPTEESLRRSREASRFIDAATRNAEVVTGMGMVEAVVQRWRDLNREVLEAQSRLGSVTTRMGAFVRAFRTGTQVGILALGAWLVIDHHLSPGVMIAGTILLARALQPVELLITGWKSLVEARGAWHRLNDVIDTQTDVQQLELPAPAGRLDLERVVFGQVAQRQPIIKGVSFSLQPGETLGLIGPSASGKTTLARLILGIWTPMSGTVRLDGADVALWNRRTLGAYLGYLPQDIELFSGTVAENIGRMGALDSAKVVRAAQQAGAHELILRLPLGYETPLGEAGSSLSGGQRQLIGLARALYGEPKLVVLDEPNANLDRDGEAALAAAVAALKHGGCTVVVIGHRPSTMHSLDKLAVLIDGSLQDFGPADKMLAKYAPPRQVAALPKALGA
ncbi:MAG: type I secretion system permease/ATPase [Burkholderiaceae bacterium]|nr:type I secretion system permease/ATPase [Burkholderiaceae bacterium]